MSEAQIGVMLPARLETRFFSEPCQDEEGQPTTCWKIKIAVIPDEPWMNRHSETISQTEAEHLHMLWESCQNDPAILKTEQVGRQAFTAFARQVGAARAWWLVNHCAPGKKITTGQKSFSRMDALPEQIEIWLGLRGDGGVELQRLEPPLTINKDALKFDAAGGAALRLFSDDRWWTKEAGLQGEYTLPFTTREELHKIECILAIGLGDSPPAGLFADHRSAGSLSLLPLGVPTNTISGAPAADLAQDPDLWWQLLNSDGEAETAGDVGLALAGDADTLKPLPGGTRAHRHLNTDLVNLLWPALWVHTLKDVWGVDRALEWREKFEIGRRTFSFELGLWAAGNFHPEGPLAPVRIGDQPYGLWPVTRLGDHAWHSAGSDPVVESEWLLNWLAPTRSQWAAAAREYSGTVAGPTNAAGDLLGANTDQFVRLLGRTPTGSDYGYRTFLPMDVLYLLSSSLLVDGDAGSFGDWRQLSADWTDAVAKRLGLDVRPLRRYLTSGTRQDLPLSLVEPPRATHVTATVAGGLLFYNASLGEGRTARFDPAGDGYQYTDTITGFSPPWTHVLAMHEDTLLFYNVATGVAARSQVDSEGIYRYLGAVRLGTGDWTDMAATLSGGLLFYDAPKGHGSVGRILQGGTIKIDQSFDTFYEKWTHIIAVNETNLLFYGAEEGLCGSAILDGNGGYHYNGGIPNVEPGWTHVVGTPEGGLLFYRASTGEAVAGLLSTAGHFQPGGDPFRIDPGWTHIVALPGSTIFFYDALSDTAAYAHLDEGGRLQPAEALGALEPESKSIFFTQLAEILEIDRDRGVAWLFQRHSDDCYPNLQTDSLLLRLILNSMALLHAEMGRMHETMDLEGLPLIQTLHPDSYCSALQEWCQNAGELNRDLLFQDDFLYDFFNQPDLPEVIAQWPIVLLYRQIFMTLESWNDAYLAAVQQEKSGQPGAIRRLLADIDRAFRAALDASAVRIDPWITGIAWRRLQELRARSCPDGLGLYAWVDRPYNGTPGPTAGGTVMAPSHAQLLTALVLRDKHINDYQADRWQIQLDSRLIRQARHFADEVRAGAHIQEALGRAVENIVANKEQIEQLRLHFRIRDEHAGRRVCDGQKILATAEGTAFLNGLNLLPDQLAALQELRQVTDTYGDLLVAGAVHAVVSGRPEKAGEIMEAAAGLELPPDFDVLRTPHTGNSVNTTVWMALPIAQPPDDGQVSPAFLADAAVAAFLEASVPAGQWLWHVDTPAGTQTVSLADLGLRAAEVLAYSEDALQRLAIDHVQGTKLLLTLANGQPASPAGAAFHHLHRLAALFSGQVSSMHNPQDEAHSQGWKAHDQELRARFAALQQAARDLWAALEPQTADDDALQRARRWGIAPAPLDDSLAVQEFQLSAAERLQHQLALAQETLGDRLAHVENIAADTPIQQVAQAIKELSGTALPIYGRVPLTLLEDFGQLQKDQTPDQEWLETFAAVRPPLARIEAHQLGQDPPLQLFSNPPDRWQARSSGAGTSAKQPGNTIVCFSPAPELDEQLAVAVLDGWSEMIPDRRHIVEAAFGFNAPSSRAPQAILLAVTPDEKAPLDTETLAHIVFEARETAHARMAVPEDLGDFAALFPLAMISGQAATGVSMQPGIEE